jgi:hypothetical protein
MAAPIAADAIRLCDFMPRGDGLEALKIVRELAELEWPWKRVGAVEELRCFYCGIWKTVEGQPQDAHNAKDCLWQQARDLIEAEDKRLPDCDCDQEGHPDIQQHASDCAGRLSPQVGDRRMATLSSPTKKSGGMSDPVADGWLRAAELAENNAQAIVMLSQRYVANTAQSELAIIRAETLREFAAACRRQAQELSQSGE